MSLILNRIQFILNTVNGTFNHNKNLYLGRTEPVQGLRPQSFLQILYRAKIVACPEVLQLFNRDLIDIRRQPERGRPLKCLHLKKSRFIAQRAFYLWLIL